MKLAATQVPARPICVRPVSAAGHLSQVSAGMQIRPGAADVATLRKWARIWLALADFPMIGRARDKLLAATLRPFASTWTANRPGKPKRRNRTGLSWGRQTHAGSPRARRARAEVFGPIWEPISLGCKIGGFGGNFGSSFIMRSVCMFANLCDGQAKKSELEASFISSARPSARLSVGALDRARLRPSRQPRPLA